MTGGRILPVDGDSDMVQFLGLNGSGGLELEVRALAAEVTRVLRKSCVNSVLPECIKAALEERG